MDLNVLIVCGMVLFTAVGGCIVGLFENLDNKKEKRWEDWTR